MTYTIKEAKENLPDVKVKIGESVFDAKLTGRLNKFATVYLKGSTTPYEFSWNTIVNSLNTGKPLLI